MAAGIRHETTWDERPLSLAWQGVAGLEEGGFLTGATVELSLTGSLSLGLGARIARGLEGPLPMAAGRAVRVWIGATYRF